ncbi:FG-GAP repeat protein [Methylococcus mesophilus]|uniref:FG-GAP repeat protein n=1 Tax=Methylococcus mesophilus TaxID=2993564 RepID=UPI00224A6B31|nr:FG-GAP repeat protein [Methylococcus mesophilus]UZR30870.1 FG-GAP repeat protein [Methylococcus mesophilus]
MCDGFRLLRTIGLVLALGAPVFGAGAAGKPVEIPPALKAAVSAELRKIEAAEGGYASLNSDHGFALRFEQGAVAVGPLGKLENAKASPAWRWGRKLTGYGTSKAIRPVAPAEAVAAAQRLEYRRGAVVEWYENRPEGLEQGFTLAAPPTPGADILVLGLAIEGGLKPLLDPGGRAVEFRDDAGATVLHYKDLQVVDAAGKSLPAHLALAEGGVQIHVDAQGAAWPIVVDPLVSSEQKVVASDQGGSDNFGYSVSISGDTAVVGAPYDDSPATDAGSAYVFTRSGSTWTQQAKLVASDAAASDYFGWSVSISGDTAVVGAYGDDSPLSNAGSAYVFTRSGSTWTEQAKLVVSDQATDDWFGYSVSVSSDTAVVGAHQDDAPLVNAGSAYVFIRSGTAWTEQAKLVASDPAASDWFGFSVSISGNTAVVGAILADSPASSAGSAYIFTRSGSAWTEQAKLVASDAAASDYFGWSVSISDDTAVVGAYGDDSPATDAGSAYVFTRSGSAWTQQAKLVAGDPAADDRFGYSVSVSGDTAVVGAYWDDSPLFNAGSAYVFTRSGATWTQQAKLVASDPAESDWFGSSVSISGNTAVVGAYSDDSPATNAGSAYMYTFPCAFGTGITATGSLATSLWKMVAAPCVPASATVAGTFGDSGNSPYSNLATTSYDNTWGLYTRDAATDAYVFAGTGDAVAPGTGYWLKSSANPANGSIVINGSATPVTASAHCASANGCYAITLTSTASASGLMNLVGNPLPYDIDWANVRLLVDDVAVYTPVAAQIGNLMSKSFSIWNGTSYDTYDDVTPGLTGALKVFQSFWVKTLPGSSGHTLKLLIPAKPSTTSQAEPALFPPSRLWDKSVGNGFALAQRVPGRTARHDWNGVRVSEASPLSALPWYLGWLDWVAPPVRAEEAGLAVEAQGAAMKAQGLAAREATRRSHASALASLKAWYVRLKVDNPALGYKDSGNILGQLADAKAGYDAYDLAEPAPFAAPYLTLVFPHKNWDDKSGAYASDYRPALGLRPMSWDIEIRADQPGSEVRVSWQGHPRILARCKITDLGTGQTYAATDPSLANGLAVFLADKVQRLTWRYLGGLGRP